MFRQLAIFLAVALATATVAANRNSSPFEPASTVEQTIRQHRVLPNPAEEVWWIPTGPDMAWNNKNLHQLFPTVNVYRDGPVRELAYKLRQEIDDYPVDTPDGELRFVDFLDSEYSTSMGVVILHKGNIAFEHYARMKEYEKPIWWSVSKVFSSTLIAILEDRGLIDVTKPVDFYLPELKNSDFSGVTVRNVLDMASGVDCPDGNYERGSCYYEFEASLNDAVRTENTADTPYEALVNMRPGRWAKQGHGFDYSGFVLRGSLWHCSEYRRLSGKTPGYGPFWLVVHAKLYGGLRREDHLRSLFGRHPERWPARVAQERQIFPTYEPVNQTQRLSVGSGIRKQRCLQRRLGRSRIVV